MATHRRKEGDQVAIVIDVTDSDVGLSSNEKGRHAELIAQMALLANGWSVLEPISPQPYDLAIRHAETHETYYVQVKTAILRNEKRYGGDYLVVKGAKNNGKVYTLDEADYFIAVYEGDCYLFPNREISEYWCKPEHAAIKWSKLVTGI